MAAADQEASTSPAPVTIGSDDSFQIDGIEFVIDISLDRSSTPGSFSIAKSEPYIRFYESMARRLSPEGVLELGIFQGGSYVLIDKLFAPTHMSAVDLAAEPVAPLIEYIADRPGHHAHFSTSQTDEAALRRIVEEEMAGKLDLVVDDASHRYSDTKRSFEILFPHLRPGGVYVIEDWSWAHTPDYQSEESSFWDEPALTNLLFEQIMLLGSTIEIADIKVLRFLYAITKSHDAPAPSGATVWDGILNRGRRLVKL